MMDMTQSIEPRSDQINSDDLIAGPITYTIREVVKGAAEQPFDFLLAETDRAYRPSKTMRRVIVAAWGAEAANYAGRRLTLYREPSIKFGGQTVGGIRISHMSHISGRVEVMAQTTRGKRETFIVQPIEDSPSRGEADAGREPASAEILSREEVGATPAAGVGDTSAVEPPSLRAAINEQIRSMQTTGESTFLSTWCQSHGIKPSSAALAERFGEDARDLRMLMAAQPADVPV